MLDREQPRERSTELLYVDLDGTLLKTDLLFESVLRLAKQRPSALLLLPVWLSTGKGTFKLEVASRIELDVAVLPYRQEVLDLIRDYRSRGCRVVLATAAAKSLADAVADHVGLFDGVIATTSSVNMSGKAKLGAIQEDSGGHPFVYVGDRAIDLQIWKEASAAIVVDAGRSLTRRAARITAVLGTIPATRPSIGTFLKAIRIHQWTKNVLIFLPLLPIVRNLGTYEFLQAATAFLAFGLCASGIYVVNDLLDLDADRAHPRKRRRPLAAGTMPLAAGPIIAFGLVLSAFLLATFLLPSLFVGILALYLLTTSAYSTVLKQRVLVDVLTLAGLYTLRVIAGSASIQIMPSFWILAFSMFLFLSLAAAKRFVEISDLGRRNEQRAKGRGYTIQDGPFVLGLGMGSGLIAVLVFALYVNDPHIAQRYEYPSALWLLCPIVLYWVSRVWLKACRFELDEDPVVFAMTDRISLALGAISVALLVLAGR